MYDMCHTTMVCVVSYETAQTAFLLVVIAGLLLPELLKRTKGENDDTKFRRDRYRDLLR